MFGGVSFFGFRDGLVGFGCFGVLIYFRRRSTCLRFCLGGLLAHGGAFFGFRVGLVGFGCFGVLFYFHF